MIITSINEWKIYENISESLIYYHGTSKESNALSIINHGEIRPGNIDIARGTKLTPIIGRTYFTPEIDMAGIYAIGANILGGDIYPELLKEGQYGYLFQGNITSLDNAIPDEDYIGQMIYHIGSNKYYNEKWQDKLKLWSDYNKDWFMRFSKETLTPIQYQKCIRYDDYGDFAVAGKKLNKTMPKDLSRMIIELGVPIAILGPVKIKLAWKIDKNLCKELKKDGSNFFEFAEKINI